MNDLSKKCNLTVGQRIGKLTLLQQLSKSKWLCECDCGNITTPLAYNLQRGFSKSCGTCKKNYYVDCDGGLSVAVTSTNGIIFYIDKQDEKVVKKYKWHVVKDKKNNLTVISSNRIMLHTLLMETPPNMEVDHKDLNRLNNRRNNLRICTHQENQCNQPLQSNNTSGVTGVSYYSPRKKYRARIKVCQHDIHLGYYVTFEEAVQARNVGMRCMFGEYGFYDEVDVIPEWIIEKVINICKRFVDLSICRAFVAYVKELEMA